MEGPTPVSALIHAATLVTAGLFLLFRISFIIEFAEITLSFICIICSCTTVFAAITGAFQKDLKRVIAFSTCSQIALRFLAYGLSQSSIALFHLLNHAFFKAALFLCAGAIIHSFHDEQDLRNFGFSVKIIPTNYIIFLTTSLALTGFPGLTGFYSKDAIFEVISVRLKNQYLCVDSNFAFYLTSITFRFTAFYSIRLLFSIFYANSFLSRIIFLAITELDFIMLRSL
jgi:NADH:ubiquinone oxidoreductase subunit 5 (subunit L)/multisubunit Na+/H+ antiporter MnhA subunit